jgi:hypothetical protein
LEFLGSDSSAPRCNASLVSFLKVQDPTILTARTISDNCPCDGRNDIEGKIEGSSEGERLGS